MKLELKNNKWISLLKVVGILLALCLLISLCHDNKERKNLEKNRIERHFSKLDGSYTPFKEYIKESLNDPSSFEHIETKFADHKDGTASVWMKFRGKNEYGDIVTKVAKCTLDINTGNFSNVIIELFI